MNSELKESVARGLHPDPGDPRVERPSQRAWSPSRQAAWASPEMAEFRQALLCADSSDIRASILDDLSTYFHLSNEDCVARCLGWEQWSIEEWQASTRQTAEEITDFYLTTKSWAFDLVWYAYLQAEGFEYPTSVVIARSVGRELAGLRHLDFGSGAGVTSQLFERLGCESHLADISTALLSFAHHRHTRRGIDLRVIDLNTEELQTNHYDVITAVDTLAHVPDVAATARALHRALKPGGLLFTNFDTRPEAPENAWHLYQDDLPLRWALQRAGFEPVERLEGGMKKYLRVEPTGLKHHARGARDVVLFKTPFTRASRRARWTARRVVARAR